MNRKDFISIAFLTLLVCIFFFNLFFPKLNIYITPDYGGSDIWRYSISGKYFLSSSLKNNRLPLWSKNIATGFPIIAEGPIGAFNIINLLLFKYISFPLSYNLGYIIAFLISSIGAYYYCRYLKFNRLISFFVSFLFSFSGMFIVHFSHYNFIQAASFFPIIILIASVYINHRKRIYLLILSLLLSQQLFFGFTQITLITTIAILLLGFFNLIKKNIKLGLFISLVVGIVMSLILSLVQFLPSKELLTLSRRKNGISLSEATYFSYPPKHFLTLIRPYFFGDPRKGTFPIFTLNNGNIFWENTGYIGIIPLIFVILSIFKIKKNNNIQFYWLLLILSILLMMGKYSPLYFIYSIPPFSYFRVPSRFILLFVWSLTILSGFGIQVLIKFIKQKVNFFTATLITGILILIGIIDLFNFSYNYNPLGDADAWFEKPETVSSFNKKEGRYYTLGSAYQWNSHLLTKGWKNTQPFYYFRNDIEPNMNIIFDIPSYRQHGALITNRYGLFSTLIEQGLSEKDRKLLFNEDSLKLLQMSNVVYIISNEVADLNKIYETKINLPEFPSYKIYAIPNVLPRAHIVYNFQKIETVEDAKQKLLSKEFNPEKEVLLEKDVSLTIGNSDNLSNIYWTLDTDQELTLRVETAKDGILVLADSYYPGWKAFVDGKETEILAANLNQRAILVNKGDHKVNFKYSPDSLKIGMCISSIGYFIIIYLIVAPIVSSFVHKSRNIS